MKKCVMAVCIWVSLSFYVWAAAPEIVAGKSQFKHVMTIGSGGSGPGQFSYVEDFAIDSQGQLLVTDANNSNVQVFEKNTGRYISSFTGGNGSKFEKPEGIAVDDDGNIFVADYINGLIQKFDKNYVHLKTFSDYGVDPGENMESEFMTIYQGRLYMADQGNNRVDVFDLEGNFLFLIGDKNDLDNPQAVKSSSEGDIYVVDMGHDKLLHFDKDGVLQRQYGKSGKLPGEFNKPVGLAVDSYGNIYVSEAHNNRIQVFDKNFNLLTYWGSGGTKEGQFNNLHGLLVDERGYVFVADTGNNRIQVFAP